MPYEIRKIKNGFKVCKKKENKCFSNKPLTLEKAKKQLKAIGMSERINQGGAKPKNMELYNRIKDEVYRKYPKHSLFRSALIVKLYKKLNGEYEGETPKMNIKKWFKQQWISLNDYLRGKIVPCGSSNTQNKYDEYPLCRPIAIAKSLTKDQIEKMIEEKNKLKEKHLKSKDVLGTDAYNIKSTLTGMGKEQNFEKQLNKIGFNTEKYLKLAQFVAKKRGYDPEKLTISDDGIHKLDYDGTKFGRVNYNDKLIYTWLELNGKIERGTTKKKFTNYRKRAKKVMEATNNKYSPASLSYYIIW